MTAPRRTTVDVQGITYRLYTTRSAAVRAARAACRRVLGSAIYEAYEGPDYEIHPQARPGEWWEQDYYFRLRGPAGDAAPAGRSG
ncbi:hypothetical protein [Mesorhizobium sp. M6A.T.Cr.TU.016.01.1.1]|uniref:hypothetical protein n=1 Tax=Mesorhizobium sp. M6A.T.Cr.TU.016.01.1.1 TaxID=2493677 RepID=UPI000F760D7A|nr:hypothetical protein [Mesorhizobium sp. M6A.T.Cr.TU.016.01.1.1]AZO67667.1 hypothetical protein EJ075_23925 [Mesorhizobium sp. M6A.T.Cr.TU.016.01.1.1]